MIMDERGEFADATALDTSGTGRDILGDVIDTGGDGINFVEDLYLVLICTTAPTSGGAATLGFELVSDAAAALETDGTATAHITVAEEAIANWTVGRMVSIPLPPGTYERYLGVLQTVGTAALTAGAFDAFLTPTPYTYKAFPDATN